MIITKFHISGKRFGVGKVEISNDQETQLICQLKHHQYDRIDLFCKHRERNTRSQRPLKLDK